MSAGAVEFYQRAKANEGAAKALYERAESREKAYARKWKETVDEGYLGEVKGKYDFVHQSYSRAVLTYERYQVLTALNKYTVNSETPEYYWGCGNEKLVWVDNEGFPSIYEMSGKGVWVPLDKGKKQYSRIESRDGGGAESEAGFIKYIGTITAKTLSQWKRKTASAMKAGLPSSATTGGT